MIATVRSFLLEGIDAGGCTVEVDLDEAGIARETVVGLPDAAVKESLERVRAAIVNTGYAFPLGRILVNLAPADVKKEGPVYDLPIAVGLLTASGVIEQHAGAGVSAERFLIAGELALDGSLRPVKGVIAMAALARDAGLGGVIVPEANAHEAAVVDRIDVNAARTLADVVELLNGRSERRPVPPLDVASLLRSAPAPIDFAEVRGQESVKRALTIAAAGQHNVLMLGPAGTGKTMMARALPGILPAMSVDEALHVTRIYSAAGKLAGARAPSPVAVEAGARGGTGGGAGEQGTDGGGLGFAANADIGGLVTARPVRSPHHTASSAAVIGGGIVPRPGEISLAHRGVLFLDELPEFPRAVLDTLRQPLESGDVTISRAHGSVTFPARFMLVAAMNPTAKGDMPTDAAGQRAMEKYVGRISRPLIDRIDIHVEAPAVPWRELTDGGDGKPGGARPGTSSAEMRAGVERARERQRRRQGRILNSELTGKQLNELCVLTPDARDLLGQAITELGLSARAYDKIRRIALSISDLDTPGAGSRGSGAGAGGGLGEAPEEVGLAAVAEAVQYRLLDRSV